MEQVVRACRERLKQQLDLADRMTDEELMRAIEDIVFAYSKEHLLTSKDKQNVVKRIYYSIRGLDVLQPLLEDPSVTEIMVNSHKEIFYEQDGRIRTHDLTFESEEKLENIIQTIVAKVNRVVNEASPIVDARLLDGSRVNVVLPPIALKGPALTIRKFPDKPLSLTDLITMGAITEDAAAFLIKAVKDKCNVFISGGTGSGKTTFLNALSQHIPHDERVITLEDSAELQIRTVPNLISLETRNANSEGKGEITMRQLIRSSLRMRPNRIVVGEVRGSEALDMLQAMNTGHDGSLSTGHANSASDMLSRLETMVLSAAPFPIEVIREQISSAIDLIVHLSRMPDYSRKVVEISEIGNVIEGRVSLYSLFRWCQEHECLERTGNQPSRSFKWSGLNEGRLKTLEEANAP